MMSITKLPKIAFLSLMLFLAVVELAFVGRVGVVARSAHQGYELIFRRKVPLFVARATAEIIT